MAKSVEKGMGQKKKGREGGKKTEREGRKGTKKGAVGVGGEVGVRGVVWLVS
ncbi:MAG: hypothetical protein GY906_38085 [bacterium]|nr:hypothetical protein [bacterium]